VIRIALRMLTADRGRFIGLVLGVAFAALLITQQMGIFLGLLGRAGAAIRDVPQAQLWIMDPSIGAIDLDDVRPMPSTAAQRVAGVDGVAWSVEHLRVLADVALGGGARKSALMVGIDPDGFIGAPPTLVAGAWRDLRRPDAVILDADAVAKLTRRAPDGAAIALAVGDEIEINDHRAVVVGIARATPPIFFTPPIYTTAPRLRAWLPAQRRDVTYVAAGVVPGADPRAVAAAVTAATGYKALTADEFAAASSWFFAENTGIPINFGIAVALGFLVGVAVCGLLFAQFVRENLRYLGTLKAMGAADGTLVAMTLVQALTVGVLGYGIGVGAAALAGWATGDGAGALAWELPPWLLAAGAAAVLAIVLAAGLAGVRRVLSLEPATVFRS